MNTNFFLAFIGAFVIGLIAELIGINTAIAVVGGLVLTLTDK